MRRRVSGWSFRLNKHSEQCNAAHFVTLTYNDETIPKTKSGLQTLQKTDLQKFFKRLRKVSIDKISYYAVGEYGSETQRPHYHIILFNADINDIENSWKLNDNIIGHVHFGTFNDATIGYTLKYITKEKRVPMFQGDDRQKEFALMSKKLGANYLTKNIIKWHKNLVEERMFLPLKDGKKASMPRYYKDKIYNEGEKFRVSVYMEYMAEIQAQKEQEEYGENVEKILSERHLNEFRKMHKKAKQRQKL